MAASKAIKSPRLRLVSNGWLKSGCGDACWKEQESSAHSRNGGTDLDGSIFVDAGKVNPGTQPHEGREPLLLRSF